MTLPPELLMVPRRALHPRLPAETVWQCLGDLTLLEASRRVPVILSRQLSDAAMEAAIARLIAAIHAGAVAVGGFVSPGERQAAKRLAAFPKARIIRLMPAPLCHYRASPAGLRRISEGHTLVLSGIPDGDGRLRRDDCVRNNRWVLALCEDMSNAKTFQAPNAFPPTMPEPEDSHSENDPAAVFL